MPLPAEGSIIRGNSLSVLSRSIDRLSNCKAYNKKFTTLVGVKNCPLFCLNPSRVILSKKSPKISVPSKELRPSKNEKFYFPQIYIHSLNPVGAANIMGYMNNFLLNENQKQSTRIVDISHT